MRCSSPSGYGAPRRCAGEEVARIGLVGAEQAVALAEQYLAHALASRLDGRRSSLGAMIVTRCPCAVKRSASAAMWLFTPPGTVHAYGVSIAIL